MIKYILKIKGYPVSWFSKHQWDIPNFWRLIGKTKIISERILYLFLAIGFPILTIVFIVSAFSHMKGLGKVDWCEYEKQYSQTEWSGVLTNKYIDKANHAYKTIVIVNNGQVQSIQNWAAFQNNYFEKIEIGDSIVKDLGFVNLRLYKRIRN